MRALVDRVFGRNSLKRGTIYVVWGMMILIVVRVFVYVSPEHVSNYERLVEGIFWPLVFLLAGIFGIQIAPDMLNRRSETTRIQTPGQTIETTRSTEPPAKPGSPE